jgi:hypothetical protein
VRKCEREKGNILDDCDTSESSSTSTVNRSGRAGLTEGADKEVGKWTTRKTEQPQEDVATTALEKETAMHC